MRFACAPLKILFVWGLFACLLSAQEDKSVREKISEAIVITDEGAQIEAIKALPKTPSPEIVEWLEKWKGGVVFLYESPDNTTIPVLMGEKISGSSKLSILRLSDGSPVLDESGVAVVVGKYEVEMADTNSKLRKAMKEVTDLAALANLDVELRIRAIKDAAIGQKLEKLPALLELQSLERFLKKQILPALLRFELPFFANAHAAASEENLTALQKIDSELDAWRIAPELRDASRRVGSQRLRLLCELASSGLITEFVESTPRAHHLVVTAIELGGIPVSAAARGYAFQSIVAATSASMKL